MEHQNRAERILAALEGRTEMIDGCHREIDHLRLSLTDHCNLACRYCVPADSEPSRQMIDGRFAFEVVRWMSVRHGIRHVRLTGGEPLLHPQLVPLIERLTKLDGLREITLTTNAQALEAKAAALYRAGLSRINISLDTLRPDRFAELTRGGVLEHTLRGIEAAVAAGLNPVRINVVAQRGLNDDELPELAAWGLARGCTVRFLEVMPIGPLAHMIDNHLVPASEITERLGEHFELREIPQPLGQPAVDYAVNGENLRGVIGIIAPTTKPFCERCRRMRVTSHGLMIACLHDNRSFDITRFWNGETFDEQGADAVLHEAVSNKPEKGTPRQTLTMLSIGG